MCVTAMLAVSNRRSIIIKQKFKGCNDSEDSRASFRK